MMAQAASLDKLLAGEAVHVQCLRHETGTRPKEAAREGGSAGATVAPWRACRLTARSGDRPRAGGEAIPSAAARSLREMSQHVHRPRAGLHPLLLLRQDGSHRERLAVPPGGVRDALRHARGELT